VGFAAHRWLGPLVRRALAPVVSELPRGPQLLVGHAVVFTAAWAVVCGLCLWGLATARVLRTPLVPAGSALRQGAVAGLVVSAVTVALWLASGLGLKLDVNLWGFAGNLFSNFYEELGYRGLIFGASFVMFRRVLPAAVVSGVAFAYTHDQFPLMFRVYAGLVGASLCYVYARGRSLLAPYAAHQVMDMILDPILKG
jgi:membrane protease YdiL (CAAX protease family)